jgi:hypothetical protein
MMMDAGDVHLKCADYLDKALKGWEKEDKKPIFNLNTPIEDIKTAIIDRINKTKEQVENKYMLDEDKEQDKREKEFAKNNNESV